MGGRFPYRRSENFWGYQKTPSARWSGENARIERPFGYIENNFLAARTFENWNDLNEQARNWCINVSNKKRKKSIGMSPDAAYVMEKPHLVPLPDYIPPVYVTAYRIIDTQGYIHLDTNRYSVPYRLIGKKAEVHKHVGKVTIYHKYKQVAEHEREVDRRDVRITDPAHRAPRHMRKTSKSASNEETCLRGDCNLLDRYVAGLKTNSRGRGMVKMRKLLELKRTYPREAFIAAVGKASEYNLYDLHRFEKIIIDEVAGNFFDL